MAVNSTDFLKDDLNRQIVDTEGQLNAIQGYLTQVDSAEENADFMMRQRIREADQIYDFWKGPSAYQYVEQKIGDYEESIRSVHQLADRVRGEMNDESSRLRRKQESLRMDLDRILEKEES